MSCCAQVSHLSDMMHAEMDYLKTNQWVMKNALIGNALKM
jgi:hypothetical protein